MASTLKNESRQTVVIILDHPAFDEGRTRATATFASQTEDGGRSVSEVRRSYPDSLTLQPGEEIADLHDAIAKCSQVPQLLAARVLSLRAQPRKPATVKAEDKS